MKYFVASICAIISLGGFSSEPIHWRGGDWDFSGAPKGALLTDNSGWWGRSVYTGVTYSYEVNPEKPGDVIPGDKEKSFGNRLIDGNTRTSWHRPVGMRKNRPIVATFDFKRPCVFNEIDLMSEKSPHAEARIEVSSDGTNWTEIATSSCTNALTRIRLDKPSSGRYLCVSYKSNTSSTSYLDEVLAWGEGEVSKSYPENIRPIPRGDVLRFPNAPKGTVSLIPLQDPTAKSKEQFGQPMVSFKPDETVLGEVLMSRNETETRYFAVVNGTESKANLALKAPNFGKGIKAELRIGGLVRTQKPKYKLTEKQKFDMLLTGDEPEDAFDANRLGFIPFFASGMIPHENFLRKYTANPEQIAHFPSNVSIEPGECAVVMLRITTDGAAPGNRRGMIKAGASSREVDVCVVDATLPENELPWIYAWAPFTPQFPFESRTRWANDAYAVRDLGVTALPGFPKKNSKVDLASRTRREKMMFRAAGISQRLDGKIYNAKIKSLDEKGRTEISNQLNSVRSRAIKSGIKPEQIFLTLVDEPGTRNAKICGEVCRFIKKIAPDMNIYLNPSFWVRTHFAPTEDIVAAVGDYYADFVDVSVPYRSLVECEKGRKALWTTPRRINASYAHPAHRAGRSIAWANFRYGLDGFAYWCYFWNSGGTPWDIRTWRIYSYEVDMVLPLENGVAITPIYEEMREAWEDWRLLALLRASGKKDVLDALLDEFARSFSKKDIETSKPYTCDFQDLRNRALKAFICK
ncbi:MAG: discoidin domain-containing protein [Kiritimatiellae bacterium]|nr:discoidin domain-containing protein [Kiritimatiellia bacterium]